MCYAHTTGFTSALTDYPHLCYWATQPVYSHATTRCGWSARLFRRRSPDAQGHNCWCCAPVASAGSAMTALKPRAASLSAHSTLHRLRAMGQLVRPAGALPPLLLQQSWRARPAASSASQCCKGAAGLPELSACTLECRHLRLVISCMAFHHESSGTTNGTTCDEPDAVGRPRQRAVPCQMTWS